MEAGLYIHIPFCKKACHYCDFHFSTLLKYRADFLHALLTEIRLRKNYFQESQIHDAKPVEISTVYFGGGTPSLLTQDELSIIFDALAQYFPIREDAEITLEGNPDDLTEAKAEALYHSPVNRLSIGIQSFFDEDLARMNRSHRAAQAKKSIQLAAEAGFKNISIDLIYGIPGLSDARWEQNLAQAFVLPVQHLSCYSLTIEPQTAFASFIKKGKMEAPEDTASATQFDLLMHAAQTNGFAQYEISNFSRPGFISRHNSAYWQGKPYLGLGPSAHSYDGISRSWNVANNASYIRALKKNELHAETEKLTPTQHYNEYILTSLRTAWGANSSFIAKTFGAHFSTHFEKELTPWMAQGLIQKKDQSVTLTHQGKFFADRITAALFI